MWWQTVYLIGQYFVRQNFGGQNFGGENFRHQVSRNFGNFHLCLISHTKIFKTYEFCMNFTHFEFQPTKYFGEQNFPRTKIFGSQNFWQQIRFSAVLSAEILPDKISCLSSSSVVWWQTDCVDIRVLHTARTFSPNSANKKITPPNFQI